MAKMTIIEGNSNDKDNVRAYMVKGEAGVSPTFETSKTGDTATITITDAEGTHEVELKDGFSPTVTASKTNKVTTVTITDISGTETTTINDGVDLTGGVPTNGVIAFDGVQADIPDGYEVSPTSFATLTNSYSTSTSEGYTANYVNGLNTFSTTEKRIGTWTDGKPIYRKVMTGTKISSTDLTFPAIINIETVVRLEGYLKANTGGSVYPLTYYGSTEIYANIEVTSAGVVTVHSATTGYSNGDITVIVEYTKTTD